MTLQSNTDSIVPAEQNIIGFLFKISIINMFIVHRLNKLNIGA